MILTVSCCHLAKILLGGISPSALSETKCKFRGNIAASDHMAELLYNIIGRFTFNHIHIQVCICACHFQSVHSGISNIKGQFRRVVEKQSKCCLSAYNDKVVGTIQRTLVFRMVWIIGTIADIAVTSFVDATVCLPKSINNIILIHHICKIKALFQADFSIRKSAIRCFNLLCYCLRIKRSSVSVFSDHNNLPRLSKKRQKILPL